jgi:hypothetical protein
VRLLLEPLLWLLLAASLAAAEERNFGMTTTPHKLQVNMHTTMRIEVILFLQFSCKWRNIILYFVLLCAGMAFDDEQIRM